MLDKPYDPNDGAGQPFTFDATPDPTLDLEAVKSDDSTYHYTS